MKQIFIVEEEKQKECSFGKCLLNQLGETKNDSTFIEIEDSKEKLILKKSTKKNIVFEHFPACKIFKITSRQL
jgi:hypothetical protein